ncbi:MAG: hypothetical protein JO145_03115 [Acidobacteriaceae bacterium]|nr:hypothetical protein [Acidobacteriaceae bacterium]MBV9765410.1 hypothetical protein [Acidobacteriaceae bacterium]
MIAGIALLTLPFCGYSQTPSTPPRPDFSGRWRMVKDKSDFRGFAVPDLVVQVVEHHDPTLNVHTVETIGAKTTTADVSYFTDGSITNNVINGRNAESKAFWDGPALMIRTNEKDSKGEDVVIEDRWELSDDKQTLTRTSHITTPKGQVDMKLVSTKEKIEG